MRVLQENEQMRDNMHQHVFRAASEVYILLVNNRQLFKGHIDDGDLKVIISDLETIVETHPGNYSSDSLSREAHRVFQRLEFFLNRIF